jgi:2'-5' RNA ligase
MPYTVQLDLNTADDSEIAKISDWLERIPGLETVSRIGDVHHISLAVNEDLPVEPFVAELEQFAAGVSPIVVQLAHLGVFPGVPSVLFLGPVMTKELFALHHRFHSAFASFAGACGGHYRPGRWVPHVTLAMNAEPASLREAIAETMEHWKPASARFDAIRLIRFPPVETIYKTTLC